MRSTRYSQILIFWVHVAAINLLTSVALDLLMVTMMSFFTLPVRSKAQASYNPKNVTLEPKASSANPRLRGRVVEWAEGEGSVIFRGERGVYLSTLTILKNGLSGPRWPLN